MAGRTLGIRVFPKQRESRQAMVEKYVLGPRLVVVAIVTQHALRTAVRVIVFVTFATARKGFGFEHWFNVARVALQRDMGPMQYVTGIDIVVERDVRKALGQVAGIALLPHVTVVIVVFAVTRKACCIHVVAERIVAMAITADE